MAVENNPDLLVLPDLLGGLTISPTDEDFGMVPVGGGSNTHIFTITNLGASGALTVTVGGAQAAEFTVADTTCGMALGAGETCTVSLSFSPAELGARAATLTVGDGTLSATATLKGAGIDPAQLAATPAAQPFGPVIVNHFSSEVTITINNGGDEDSGLLTVMLTGTDAVQFLITDKPCDGASIPAGGSCDIKMKFHPISTGNKVAGLEITASPGGRVVVPLTGSGAADAALTLTAPAQPSLDYDTIATGTTSTLSVTITNSGGVASGSITTALSGPDAARFAVTQACGAIAPGASCTIMIAFNPNSQANFTADLDISGAPGGTISINLIGTGAAPAALGITGDLSFGRVAKAATSAEQTLTITNTGGVSTGAPVVAALQGGDLAMFTITSNTCNTALAAGGKCRVKVTFNPPGNATVGDKSTTLHVTAPAVALAADATLSGRAVNQASLSITPTGPADFGAVVLGGTPATPILLTVTNTGGVSTPTALHVELSDTTNFSITVTTCEGTTLTATPGTDSCTVTIGFTPTTNGTLTTTLSVSFDLNGAQESTETKNVKGIANAPAALDWKPNTRSYGKVRVGANGPYKTFTLVNTGDVATAPITISETGNLAAFDLDRNPSPSPCGGDGFTLAGGASCNVQQRFSPNAVGARTLTMKADDSNVNSSAVLNGNGAWRLSVAKAGTGSGSVNSNDIKIACGADCAELYTVDQTQVTLTASPEPTSVFDSWINCSPSPSPTCIAVMDANKTVTANFNIKPVTLTVNKTGNGRVQSFVNGFADGKIDCDASCTNDSADYQAGTLVELRSAPSALNVLQKWGGDCSQYGLCQFIVDQNRSVTATFTPINRMFVTSGVFNGNLGGLAGADAKCASAAAAANLGGSWKAYLSDGSTDANARFASTTRGWARLDGLPVIDRLDIHGTTRQLFYPISVTENGTPLPFVVDNSRFVWSGTKSTGLRDVDHCSNWTSASDSVVGAIGSPVGSTWPRFSTFPCGAAEHLVCMEDAYEAPIVLPPAPVGARHAFVSKPAGVWPSSPTGLAVFDGLCQGEAASANLPNANKYKALIATLVDTPISRFTDGTWYRLDEAKLFSMADLMAGKGPVAPFVVSADRGYSLGANVGAGATSVTVVGSAADTCNGWTSTQSTDTFRRGMSSETTTDWFGNNLASCTTAIPTVYCLEDQ